MTTAQAPIGSGFRFESTAAEVVAGIDLTGKIALVTGGYSGIGTETVKALAGAGAKVVVAARRPETAHEVLGDLASVVALSLDDPPSIDACADAVAGQTGKIDLLILNAAIMANPLSRDARGFESQFATNHLGHFQLAARLWPLVAAAGEGARVVALSSLGHKRSAFHAEDPNYETRPYEKWEAYGQAKTCNALFALQLDALAAAKGVRAFAVHPGGIMTNLGRFLTDEDRAMFAARRAAGLRFKTPEQGAATTVWAATSPQLVGKGGVYCEDCDIAELTEAGIEQASGVMAHARDAAAAARLWEVSEKLTGVRFAP
jgi:NAD(P)-dependent dehydrogenase (short-subunit alcohol dehydrogenase family)